MHPNKLAFAAVLAMAGPAFAQDSLPRTKEPITWLFIQTATSMQFDGDMLVLSGLAPSITAFSDRPYRLVAPLSATGFVDLWTEGTESFETDPPNAGLSAVVDGQLQAAVVELGAVRLDGDSMSFGIEVLEGNVPPAGGYTSLFIDAFPTALNSQITDAVTQTNTKELGDQPAIAMGSLYQATAQALANAAQNATNSQQQSSVTSLRKD